MRVIVRTARVRSAGRGAPFQPSYDGAQLSLRLATAEDPRRRRFEPNATDGRLML